MSPKPSPSCCLDLKPVLANKSKYLEGTNIVRCVWESVCFLHSKKSAKMDSRNILVQKKGGGCRLHWQLYLKMWPVEFFCFVFFSLLMLCTVSFHSTTVFNFPWVWIRCSGNLSKRFTRISVSPYTFRARVCGPVFPGSFFLFLFPVHLVKGRVLALT